MRPVRQAHGRVKRAGYTASIRQVRDVEQSEFAEVRAAAAAWRGDVVERGFSMALSRLGDPADGDCVLITGRRPDGRLAALLHLCPWGPTGCRLI
jgi:lysyl-tRNA synthetase class 2